MDLFVGKHVPEEGGVVTLVELSRRSEVMQGGADRDEAGPGAEPCTFLQRINHICIRRIRRAQHNLYQIADVLKGVSS